MESTFGRVHVHRPSVALAQIIIDNEGHRNALTLRMWDELIAASASIQEDPRVRVVVLRGAGEQAFSTGADISEFLALRNDAASVQRYNDAIASGMRGIAAIEAPVIACIRGICVGGGVALAAMCDLRYMASSSTLSLPAAKLGIAYLPEWAQRLTALVGPGAASEITLTAQSFDSETAGRWGFANRVLPDRELMDYVDRLADRIAGLAPLSLRASKQAIRIVGGRPSKDEAQGALEACRRCDESEDYQIGVEAFLSKRKPEFRG